MRRGISLKKVKKSSNSNANDDSKTKQVTKKQRKKFSKLLRDQQEMLQSISESLDISSFLSQKTDDVEDPDIIINCPRCRYSLSRDEVLAGFEEDNVIDHKTTCPDCDHKFNTINYLNDIDYKYVWLCQPQTKDQFDFWKSKRDFKDDDDIIILLAEDRPEIVLNAYNYSDKDNFKIVKEAIENWLEI